MNKSSLTEEDRKLLIPVAEFVLKCYGEGKPQDVNPEAYINFLRQHKALTEFALTQHYKALISTYTPGQKSVYAAVKVAFAMAGYKKPEHHNILAGSATRSIPYINPDMAKAILDPSLVWSPNGTYVAFPKQSQSAQAPEAQKPIPEKSPEELMAEQGLTVIEARHRYWLRRFEVACVEGGLDPTPPNYENWRLKEPGLEKKRIPNVSAVTNAHSAKKRISWEEACRKHFLNPENFNKFRGYRRPVKSSNPSPLI